MARSTWNIDTAHSSVDFVARHMVVTRVRGHFKSYRGTVELDEADLTSARVDVTIDAASIDTNEEKRDAHLRSAEFFDVEQYPALTFKSTKVAKKGDRYAVTGDLTIHGVTRQVVLDASFDGKVKDPWGNQRLAFSASTSVNREDYGLEWNQVLEAGGVLVGSKIEINLEVQALPAQAAKAA